MRARAFCLGLAIWLIHSPALRAQDEAHPEKISIAVMEFVSKGGVEQNKMDALSDMMANQIRDMGEFKVIGKADIRAALQLEEQKTVLGCTDESCLAEIGGALGVRYIVVGNISLLGSTWLLNLKLLDVANVEVVKGVSRSITGAEDKLIAALQEAAFELMKGIEGVQLIDPGAVKEAGGEPGRRESGWFVPPGGRGGDFHLAIGLGVVVAPPVYLKGNDLETGEYFTDLQKLYGAAWLNLYAGYNFASWFTLAVRLGGTLGSAEGRKRNAFEAALELQGSMMGDSWFQPVAYLDVGFVFLRDESSDAENVEGQRIEAFGIVTNLGIGANMFFTPNWFVGGRLGGMVRTYFALFNREVDTTLSRISGARAFEIGVNVALVTGFEF